MKYRKKTVRRVLAVFLSELVFTSVYMCLVKTGSQFPPVTILLKAGEPSQCTFCRCDKDISKRVPKPDSVLWCCQEKYLRSILLFFCQSHISECNSRHLLQFLRQHRTKSVWRLCTPSACKFPFRACFVFHKNAREYIQYSLRFLFHLTKNLTTHLSHNLCAVLP